MLTFAQYTATHTHNQLTTTDTHQMSLTRFHMLE